MLLAHKIALNPNAAQRLDFARAASPVSSPAQREISRRGQSPLADNSCRRPNARPLERLWAYFRMAARRTAIMSFTAASAADFGRQCYALRKSW